MTRSVALFAGAFVALLVVWALTHHTTSPTKLIVDTPVYERYGIAIVSHHEVPYRDFGLEYPPGALPVFILPAADPDHFGVWFDREMALCAGLALLGVFLITRSPEALGLVALAPMLLGPVVLSRFDYWPAALTVLGLAALLRRRLTTSAVLLGLAVSAKLWPAVLVPFALVWVARNHGRRSALRFAAAAGAVVAAIFIPFVTMAPGGVWHSVRVQFARPLQLESLGSAILIAIHHVFGGSLGVGDSFGSQNPVSDAAGPVGVATSVLLALALLALFAAFVRGEMSRERLLTACAGAATALLAFGKVFSPQFLVWLIPLVPLVPSVAAGALLVAALLLTQSYFPRDYWNFANGLYERESIEVLVRDLVVVALFALLLSRVARRARALRPGSEGAAGAERPAAAAHRAA